MDEQISREPEEQSLGAWFLRAWATHPGTLLGMNLMFLVACIPVLTIPAAVCGLNAAVQRLYRQRFAESLFRVFWREFLEKFPKRTAMILGLAAIPTAAVFLLKDVTSVWALVLAAVLMALTLVTLSWFIPQLVLLNLKPGQALKNACIFTCIETKVNFILIAIHAVELTAMIYALPTSAFALLILPVLHTVVTTGLVMPVLQDKLVWEDDAT